MSYSSTKLKFESMIELVRGMEICLYLLLGFEAVSLAVSQFCQIIMAFHRKIGRVGPVCLDHLYPFILPVGESLPLPHLC